MKYRFNYCVFGCFGDRWICDPCALCCNEYKGDVHQLEAQIKQYRITSKANAQKKKAEAQAKAAQNGGGGGGGGGG